MCWITRDPDQGIDLLPPRYAGESKRERMVQIRKPSGSSTTKSSRGSSYNGSNRTSPTYAGGSYGGGRNGPGAPGPFAMPQFSPRSSGPPPAYGISPTGPQRATHEAPHGHMGGMRELPRQPPPQMMGGGFNHPGGPNLPPVYPHSQPQGMPQASGGGLRGDGVISFDSAGQPMDRRGHPNMGGQHGDPRRHSVNTGGPRARMPDAMRPNYVHHQGHNHGNRRMDRHHDDSSDEGSFGSRRGLLHRDRAPSSASFASGTDSDPGMPTYQPRRGPPQGGPRAPPVYSF
ncbi:MAG: hypothetical protein M1833_003690 [Piccolia ochrophora]|nr:MAG: hypothetical protein M1833_003690 [Piccolia ochrophora]